MHEIHLLKDLINKLERIAEENDANRVTKIKLRCGALSHISPEYLRYHFMNMTKGRELFNDTHIEIEVMEEIDDHAYDILLESVSLE